MAVRSAGKIERPPRYRSSCCPQRRGLRQSFGLELGADDYMIKPFDSKRTCRQSERLFSAVIRRLRSAYHSTNSRENMWGIRTHRQPDELFQKSSTRPLCGYAAEGAGAHTSLPPLESGLCREQLLDHIWGYKYIGDTRTVDVTSNAFA